MMRVPKALLVVGCIVTVSASALPGPVRAAGPARAYYVQLVRGTDAEQAPEPGNRRIGPKLAAKFQQVFKWKGYWEVCRRKVEVPPARARRVPLSHGREVEIDLTHPQQRKVTVFKNGEVLGRTVEPASEGMTLIGGERDKHSAWFVVVRRDQPGN